MSTDGWEYIGDGVYVKYDGFGVMLHANDHLDPSDKVYLEPGTLAGLVEFYKKKTQPKEVTDASPTT